jgi:GNAT superfamily N-acetyltransferase
MPRETPFSQSFLDRMESTEWNREGNLIAVIHRARADETNRRSEIAYHAKAHWGYSAAFMEACRAELSITPRYLKEHSTFVLCSTDEASGFYSLERISKTRVELGHFFLWPDEIGRGRGRRLFSHACEQARQAGFQVLVIASDPHAEGFYLTVGAQRVGSTDSESIPGRTLPLLEFDLRESESTSTRSANQSPNDGDT